MWVYMYINNSLRAENLITYFRIRKQKCHTAHVTFLIQSTYNLKLCTVLIRFTQALCRCVAKRKSFLNVRVFLLFLYTICTPWLNSSLKWIILHFITEWDKNNILTLFYHAGILEMGREITSVLTPQKFSKHLCKPFRLPITQMFV
jgi:hypothetical protein